MSCPCSNIGQRISILGDHNALYFADLNVLPMVSINLRMDYKFIYSHQIIKLGDE